MKFYHLILSFCLLFCFACQREKTVKKNPPIITSVSEKDFEEANQVAPILVDGLQLDLWAPGPLLSNAVALTFDNQGVAYVSETARRKSSDIDIRQHSDWMTEDIGLQTLADTRTFHLKKLATELSDQNTWLIDFNKDGKHDYRDLSVQTEYVRRIWDSDGDGRADKSQLYASGFNTMLTGVAAGILSYEEDIFLTIAPDIFRLKDTDNNGVADKRTVISHGYGIHIAFAGHDMSGLTMGPDGRIYWSIGDIGVNVLDKKGKRWAYPNQGAVMRCNPDGSDFEVYAHGLRNPQEIAFDVLGNLISVDNDGDHQGEHERYIHIVEGSDSGWRTQWQYGKYNQPNEEYKVWMDEKLHIPHFAGQAAYLLPPLALAYDGPAGLAYNPGTALNEKWNNHFFASYFTGSAARSKIQTFEIIPKGASFEVSQAKDIIGGIVPTGITFASDGALYINDWKDSYSKKPAGRIWKLQAKEPNLLQKETQRLLKEGLRKKSIDELSKLIAHTDQRVRMKAQFELVRRKKGTTLLTIAKTNTNLLGRVHAIWGLGQLARQNSNEASPLLPLLKDLTGNIRAQAAKVIGDAKYLPAFTELLPLLKDSSPKVQFFAAEALGKIGNENAFQPLVELLEKVEETDPHLRHTIIFALSRLNQANLLAELISHPSKHVRIGAVVALRMMQSPKVADFLKDKEVLVLAEAARAIHDDFSIPAALPALAKSLKDKGIKNEAFLRRAINANLRIGDANCAFRLARFANQKEMPEAMRLDALWALGYWANPPELDRVDNRYRKLEGHKLEAAQKAMSTIFPQLLAENTSLKKAVIIAAGRLDCQFTNEKTYTIYSNQKEEISIRVSALNTLGKLNSPNLSTAINQALTDNHVELRKAAQSLLEKVNLPKSTIIKMYEKILDNNTLKEQQKVFASLVKIKDKSAEELLKKWWKKYMDKTITPELQLDLLNAIDNSDFEILKMSKATYEKKLDATNSMTLFEPTLYGGDLSEGLRILTKNNTAQCLRCHVVQGKGSAVGPPLDGIADKLDRKDLLLSLVNPNARIAEGYGTIILNLKNGDELAGILMGETENLIQIKVGKAAVKEILKSKIIEKEVLPSGMFNMGEVLTKMQLRDLMAYLVTLKME